MPLLIVSWLLIIVVVCGLYFWRSYQASQTAKTYFGRAQELREQQEWQKASESLYRYLQLRPGDPDAQILLAETSRQWRIEERALSYIRNHLGDPISLDEVAEAAYTSKPWPICARSHWTKPAP